MTSIAYSRGGNKFDNRPQQRRAADFDAFVAALDRDRSAKKGGPWIAGPFNGDGRRCAEGALPRRWLALDFDRIADREVWADLRQWLQRFKGCAWPTHSSTPDAPRERVILALTREAARDECIAIGERLSAELVKRFGDAIDLDPSTYRPEQPIYVPPTSVKLARFEGEPLNVDAYLAAQEARAEASDRPKSAEQADDDLLHRIERGERLHDALLALIGRMAAKGLDRATIEAAALGLIERARRVRPDRADELAGGELARMIDGALQKFAPHGGPWPDPAPLPSELPAVDAFDLALLPDVLRPWIADIADRMQCPPDFPAVAAMAALGSLLGRKVCIRPKRLDSWYEAPNLWGCIVGRPSQMKSPALNDALRPLRELEGEAAAAHAEAMRDWQMHKATRQIERKAASASAIAAAKKGASFDPAALIDTGDDEEPALRRYIVNNFSVEALGEVLMHNPNGTLAYGDELIGLLRQLDREGNESARAFYLTGWTGKEPYTFDRIGRGLNRRIEHVCLGLLGSIQPAVIGQYVREAVAQSGGDGLMARFSLLVWPDAISEYQHVDRLPDAAARGAAFAVFRRFDELTPERVGAARDFGDVFALRFDPEAQEVFAEVLAGFERRLRAEEANGTHPALIVHLTKYRKLIPALALICHLADVPAGGPVSMDALRRAIRWAEYLESHARRLYASVMRPDVDGARELLRRIRRGEIGDGFRVRDVYRNGWTRLADTEQAKQAAELLCDFDYLRRESEPTAGRWTERYRVHPKLLAEAAEYLRKAAEGH